MEYTEKAKKISAKKEKKSLSKLSLFLYTFRTKRLITVASSWVFFFLLSVVPLLFLLISAFGVFGVDIATGLVSRLPEEFRSAGQAIIETANKVSKEATIFFVITSIISCSSLLNRMSKDGDSIYGIRSKRKIGIFRRIWAIVALAVLFAVFLLSAIFVLFGSIVIEYLGWGRIKGLVTLLFFTLLIFIVYVIIILLNLFISPMRIKLREVLLGSFLSLVTIVIGTIGFIIFLRYFHSYNAFYGSLASIIVFLLWAYIVMLGLVSGAILNMILVKKKREHTEKRLNISKKVVGQTQ